MGPARSDGRGVGTVSFPSAVIRPAPHSATSSARSGVSVEAPMAAAIAIVSAAMAAKDEPAEARGELFAAAIAEVDDLFAGGLYTGVWVLTRLVDLAVTDAAFASGRGPDLAALRAARQVAWLRVARKARALYCGEVT